MARIIIRGSAAVFKDDQPITDLPILQSLNGLAYEDERFTDYLGGPPEENALAALLEPGGVIRFGHQNPNELLSATTEYVTRRLLSDAQLKLLVEYTMSQWSDGIGENWTSISTERCGYSIMCLTAGDGVGADYPSVEVIE